MRIFLSGTSNQIKSQVNGLINYYGYNTPMCEVIANETLISGGVR